MSKCYKKKRVGSEKPYSQVHRQSTKFEKVDKRTKDKFVEGMLFATKVMLVGIFSFWMRGHLPFTQVFAEHCFINSFGIVSQKLGDALRSVLNEFHALEIFDALIVTYVSTELPLQKKNDSSKLLTISGSTLNFCLPTSNCCLSCFSFFLFSNFRCSGLGWESSCDK